MEEAFFKFGKKDTTFEWNDPTPAQPEAPSTDKPGTEPKKEGESGKDGEKVEDKKEEIEE